MEKGFFVYAWDLAEESPQAALKRIQGLGANMVCLASSYHAGKFTRPRAKQKIYFPVDGTVYFEPNQQLYGSIQPKRNPVLDQYDFFRDWSKYNKDLRLKAWTVCTHNSPQGLEHPELCVRNAFGDPYISARTMYMALLGDFESDTYSDTFEWTLFIMFSFLVMIILLNVLIAIVSDSYDAAMAKSEALYYRSHLELVTETAWAAKRAPRRLLPTIDEAWIKESWERIKAEERAEKPVAETPASRLDGIARTLPAMARAEKLQRRAARHGFDWPDIGPVFDKLHEEIDELKEAWQMAEAGTGDLDAVEDELGDLLFVCVNLARFLKVNPEQALKRTNHKFDARFRAIERVLEKEGRNLDEETLEALDAVWQSVKGVEKE